MQSELIHKSDLRVYLSLEDTTDTYENVNISLLYLNGTVIKTNLVNIVSSDWLTFEVGLAVNFWFRSKIANKAGFKIRVTTANSRVCDQNLVLKTERTGDFVPLLTVYSYETEESKSSFIQIVEKAMEQTSSVPGATSGGVKREVTRSADSLCHKESLRVETAWLNDHIFKEQTILGPEEIQVNTCQGSCTGPSIRSRHSSLLYLLDVNNYAAFDNSEDFDQHCVPVEYKPITILLQGEKSYIIENLGTISVKECGCVYVHKS